MSLSAGNPDSSAEAFAGYASALQEVFDLPQGSHWCELAPDGIVCLDAERRLLFLNAAAQRLFTPGEPLVAGHSARQSPSLWTLLEELDLEAIEPANEGQDSPRIVRRMNLRRGEGRIPLEVAASVSWRDGRRIFSFVTRVQTQSGAGQQALYQSQKRQMIGALAGGVAHDFNNILTAVIGNLDLALSDEDVPERTRECLQQAIDAARRGAELNTKLLSFSRHSDAVPVTVNVARLIEETVFILRRSIDPRIKITLAPAPKDIWPVRVDEGQFMQVLMNLCLNARDAMPKGGELIFKVDNSVFGTEPARSPRHAGEFLQVTVSDTGHGMTPEVLEGLFEPYFTTKEFGKGAGLGLSIANHVVVENGGWIEVESEPGRGSHFHVFLPRTRASSPATTETSTPKAANISAYDGKETILLVDDESSVRTVINAVLSYRGYRVLEAGDGNQALEKFRTAKEPIHLVLLDIRMPSMNGWDTMDRLHEMNPKVPVVLLSGGSSDPPDDRTSKVRAAGVLRKPFAGNEVLRAVRGALDGAKSAG